jgi:hypothetical protein
MTGAAEFGQGRSVYREILFAVSVLEASDNTVGQDRHAGGRKQQEMMRLRQPVVARCAPARSVRVLSFPHAVACLCGDFFRDEAIPLHKETSDDFILSRHPR